MKHVVTMRVASGSYDVTIGADTLGSVSSAVAECKPDSLAVVTHPKLMEWYGGSLLQGLDVCPTIVTVPAGERSKSLASAARVLARLAQGRFSRGGLILALGGGVVGDLAGFAAAVYHRGARYIQLPTTLLAQVDASVGGKVGVDLPSGKNLVGAFLQPQAVIADTSTLKTLPLRHIRNGMAEVLKYGFTFRGGFADHALAARRPVFRRDPETLAEIVTASIEMKAAVVEEDEFDRTGSRARLNFGHTVGHAIETALGYRQLLHGEAISIGMVAEARLSAKLGLCSGDAPAYVERALAAYSLPVRLPHSLDASALVSSMHGDKKAEGGDIVMALLRDVGRCELVRGIDPRTVRDALEGMREGG